MANADMGALRTGVELRSDNLGYVIVILGLFVFAVWFRLMWHADYSFPINDGALFVVIAEAIIANGMVPPTEYDFNNYTLPLAYPPLGLWLAAAVSKVTGADLLLVAAWYPFALNLILMAGFVLLLRAMKLPWMVIVLASALFFFQDRTFKFLIMGGGITRGTGAMFAIFAMWAAVRMFETPRLGWVVTAGVLCGLAILSHLEYGITAATCITIVALFSARPFMQRAGLLVAVGAISFAVITPWLYWVLSAHGLEAFKAASQTSGWCWICSTQGIARAGFLPWYIMIPGIIGALELARQRKHIWLVLALAIYILTPRHAPSALVLPNSVLAAYGLFHIFRLIKEGRDAWTTPTDGSQFTLMSTPMTNAVFVALTAGVWTMIGATISNIQLTGMETLGRDTRAAMNWVHANVEHGSDFIVYGAEPWATDETAEWFPYFSGSYSVSTAQGTEWVGGDYFKDMLKDLATLTAQRECPALVETALSGFPDGDYLFAIERMHCFDADPRMTEILRRPGIGVYAIDRAAAG